MSTREIRAEKKPHEKAAETAKKTTTLAKAHITRESRNHGGRWQWVDFLWPKRSESSGIVDFQAIRKKSDKIVGIDFAGCKSLDLFDIMLVQVKGGSAKMPSPDDISRMERVPSGSRGVTREYQLGQQSDAAKNSEEPQ